MKLYLSLLSLILLFVMPLAYGQVDDGLRAYYTFDDCTALDSTSNDSDGTLFGGVGCACGVSGMALEFDGVDDYVVFFGFVNTYFDDDDFTLSFYYKNNSNNFQRSLFSKKSTCSDDPNFDVRVQASQTRVITDLSVAANLQASSIAQVDLDACWQHIAITRDNTVLRTYVNGVQVDQTTSSVILDVDNNAILSFANSPCIGLDGTRRFEGLLDEVRVYNRALSRQEIGGLYLGPDQIENRDTLVFLGESVSINLSPTCATDFQWSPVDGVENEFLGETLITPDSTTTYTLSFIDEMGCVAQDTVMITVVDPSTIGCTEVLLPTAFTPNNDGLNDNFRISNPQGISEFLSFEVFNRWGSRVYLSDEPFTGWDGTFKGKSLQPGVFVYQVRFICEGIEKLQTGTVTLMK